MSNPDDRMRRRDRAAAASGASSAPQSPVEPDGAEQIERTEEALRAYDPPHAGSPPEAGTTPVLPTSGTRGRAHPHLEPPSPDVAPVAAESGMPGVHRGGFERWPTAPIEVDQAIGPIDNPETAALVQWAPAEPRAPYRGLAAWALGFAVVALAVSTVVGWGFPIGLIAIVSAIVALRRPLESRAMATWALVLGIVSVLYSAGWLWFAASRTDLLG